MGKTMRAKHIDRRQFVGQAGATLAVPMAASLPFGGAVAQEPITAAVDPFSAWRELGQLTARAVDLGISVPRMTAQINIDDDRDYAQIMPAGVELIESLERPDPRRLVQPGEVEKLLEAADELLRKVHQAERNLPDEREAGMSITATAGRPSFTDIKDDYRRLFDRCTVREKHRSTVNWYMSKLSNEGYQARWYKVAQEICCPWYFVAIIHAMEAAFNFRSHLHNGDSLRQRTRRIPRNRPKVWSPPNDWQTSAVDALRFDGFQDLKDWSLERMLHRWESYNGFRSRRNGINTPYLWSFSNHYAKGKFVADNVWDPNAVSKQCGAAVLLRVLVDRKLIRLDA